MKQILLFIQLLVFPVALFSQSPDQTNAQTGTFIRVWGKVADSITGKPLAYVNLAVRHKPLNAVTSEIGEFVFNLSGSSLEDTLVITLIGYHTKELLVKNVHNSQMLEVKLVPKEVFLQDVTVRSKKYTAIEVVKKAMEQVPLNYETETHLLKGFYRDWKTVDFAEGPEDNGVLIEAAVNVIDGGYARTGKRNGENIYIKEIRRSELPKNARWNYYNSLKSLLHANQVKYNDARNFSDPSAVLLFPNNFLFTFSDTSNDENYFIIEASIPDAQLVYTFYIRVGEFAVERIDYKNKNEFTRGDWRIKFVDNTQRFRKWNGKWYLSYMRHNWQIEHMGDRSAKLKRTESYNMELLVNDIRPKGKYTQVELGYLADEKKPLEFQVKAYNDAFWQNYNVVEDNPLNPVIKNFFEKKKTLREQYVRSGTMLLHPELIKPLPRQWGSGSKWIFNKGDTLQGSLNKYRSCYDVHFYDLQMQIDPALKKISGVSNIHFITTEPTNKIQIDLDASLAIKNIKWKGKDLAFSREYNAVFIDIPETLLAGTKQDIVVTYGGNPLEPDFRVPNYGAFVWSSDEHNKPWIQSICQGSGANGWWPNKDHLSDKPDSVLLTITIPSDLVIAANGQFISKQTTANWHTYQWKVSYPILNYNIAINIGDYAHWKENYNGVSKLALQYYTLKQDKEKAAKAFKVVVSMLSFYEKQFGPYPFPADGFKLVQAPYPMEHQSCVSVGKDFDEELILHETAHEWWGNSVSCSDLADIWIHEAFATYAVYLFIEANRSKEDASKYLDYLAANIKGEFPLVGNYGLNHIHYDFKDAYSKGALLLHTVRNLIANDSLWTDILQGLQKDYKYRSIATTELINYVSTKANKDLGYLFEQFLFHAEQPNLEIKLTPFQKKLKITYRWQNTKESFKMPVRVTTSKHSFNTIYPTASWNEIELDEMDINDFKVESNKLIKVSIIRVE